MSPEAVRKAYGEKEVRLFLDLQRRVGGRSFRNQFFREYFDAAGGHENGGDSKRAYLQGIKARL